MDTNVIELVRKPRAQEITGHRHAKFQERIVEGLLPTAVKISERCSAWPLHELVAVNRAIVAGKSSDEIKRLVSHLLETRRLSESDPILVAMDKADGIMRAQKDKQAVKGLRP